MKVRFKQVAKKGQETVDLVSHEVNFYLDPSERGKELAEMVGGELVSCCIGFGGMTYAVIKVDGDERTYMGRRM